jgi:hypothetical protein
MADAAWKQRERQAAAVFGARRARLSGSSGCEGESSSDSTHPRLYIETKLRAKHTTRTLHDDVRAKAKAEGKAPVLLLADGGRPGLLVVIHTDDLDRVLAERLAERVRAGEIASDDLISQYLKDARIEL